MPWKTELPMEQRQRFISLIESGHFTISEICKQFKVSRKTGHKWIGRYREFGSPRGGEGTRSPVISPPHSARGGARYSGVKTPPRAPGGPIIRGISSLSHTDTRLPPLYTRGAWRARRGYVSRARHNSSPERGGGGPPYYRRVAADNNLLPPPRAVVGGGRRGLLVSYWSSMADDHRSGEPPGWLLVGGVIAADVSTDDRRGRADVGCLVARADDNRRGINQRTADTRPRGR